MKPLPRVLAGIGPLALSWGIIAYYYSLNLRMRAEPAPQWAAGLLFASLPLAVDLVVARARHRRGSLMRLGFYAALAVVFVGIPLRVKGTVRDWIPIDLICFPYYFRAVWLTRPLWSCVLAVLCAAGYVRWTVWRRRWWLATTVAAPLLCTFALFILMYWVPVAGLLDGSGQRPDFVTRVWRGTSADYRFPRDVMVTRDEQFAVATFGTVMSSDASDPPPGDDPLRLCDPPDAKRALECRRNLDWINLRTGETRFWPLRTSRRFFSEDRGRFFDTPWYTAKLLDLTADGALQAHQLPDRLGGWPLWEVNETYYSADAGRVYLTSGENPVVVAWDTQTERVVKTLQLVDWNGITPGDSTECIARSRTRHRLYVTMKSFPFRTVEIDERDMKPLRSFDGGPAFDIQLSPDEKSLYTASFLSGEIRRFDADSLRLEAVLPAPLQCRRIAFSPDGGLLFAASYVSGEVQVYDTRDNRAIQSFYVGRRLEGLDAQGNGLYVLSAEGLFRIPLDALGPGGRQGGNQAASP